MKKVLIITYYWPPAGGPGVQRVLKFVKYLYGMGWQPIILTVENPSSPAIDNSLLNDIPKECIVYKTKAFEPFGLYKSFTGKNKNVEIPKDIIVKKKNESIKEKFSRWVRANIFIPDARLGWMPYLVKEGLKIVEKEKPDIIFSTSPPHSLQIGARKLAKKTGLKWVADFRDPWSEAYWESEIGKSKWSLAINRRLELKTLKHANTVTTVSSGIVDLLSAKMNGSYEVLYNGFEEINKDTSRSNRFNIIFIGNLSKYQNPQPFIEAVKLLPKKTKDMTDIYFVGKVFDDFKTIMENENVILKNYMNYNELMQFCRSAGLLLLVFHKTSYTLGYITAKMFDYLALRKPILAIGKKNSIGEKVLSETNSGKLFENEDITQISDYIQGTFSRWENGESLLLPDNESLKTYSTKQNVKKLVDIFERQIN